MQRVHLNKNDKKVFRNVFEDGADVDILPRKELIVRMKYLRDLGLIEIKYAGGEFQTARLTNLGEKYKLDNPHLKNPITINQRWFVTTIIAVIALILSAISIFRS